MLKLLIDKKSDKVLFGKASKDVVDFIFSLLALPLGAITKLLTKDAMVGSIGEIYHSLGMLNETYILSKGEDIFPCQPHSRIHLQYQNQFSPTPINPS